MLAHREGRQNQIHEQSFEDKDFGAQQRWNACQFRQTLIRAKAQLKRAGLHVSTNASLFGG